MARKLLYPDTEYLRILVAWCFCLREIKYFIGLALYLKCIYVKTSEYGIYTCINCMVLVFGSHLQINIFSTSAQVSKTSRLALEFINLPIQGLFAF
jgi:hypothetical protein